MDPIELLASLFLLFFALLLGGVFGAIAACLFVERVGWLRLISDPGNAGSLDWAFVSLAVFVILNMAWGKARFLGKQTRFNIDAFRHYAHSHEIQ